jgi:hypothetical protein
MEDIPFELPIVCFLFGVVGAVLGAWACWRWSRARLQAQELAFELAREKAGRDLQQVLLCVPQWVQKAVRLEFEFLARQQAERWNEAARQQRLWLAEQDSLRQSEWLALLRNAGVRVPAGQMSRGGPRPMPAAPPRPAASSGPRAEPQNFLSATAPGQQIPERELSDAEIDALPPDLPIPARPPGKKLPAPRGRVLRNI